MSLELICQLYRHQLHSLQDFESWFFFTLSSILKQSWHNIDTMLTQCWLCRRYPIHEERHFPLSTWLTLDERQFPLVQLRTIDSCFSANPGLKTVSFCPTFHVGLVLKHVCSSLWWFSLPLPVFLAVQDSSIGDLVTQWVSESVSQWVRFWFQRLQRLYTTVTL